MSINNSYFSRNNTIVSRSFTNTGRNPVTEIFYGSLSFNQYPNGFSRFIFNIDLDLLLEPTRPEDKGNDLWSVFNVIQEKILDGSFTYMSGAKIRKARKVKNFKQDLEINQKLFAMAAEFIAA